MKYLLLLFFLLMPSLASAQCNGIFPSGTFCGNTSGVPAPPGPTSIAGHPTSVNITRAQIATNTLLPATIVVNGYRTANDLGFGATYSTVGASCPTGLMAITSADGVCYNLVLSQQVSVGWFGAYADDGNELITAPDIVANPQWRGTYTAGMTWDYVAIQESMYAAFAKLSTPGVIVWNATSAGGPNTYNNVPLYVPQGRYDINRTILTVASQGRISFAQKASATWNWTGAKSSTLWVCDACSYMVFDSPSLENDTTEDWGTAQPLWKLDWTGTYDSLKTQQNTINNLVVSIGINGQGISIAPSGGGSQGDTIAFINPLFIGFLSDWALTLNGSNALAITLTNGDFQGFIHDSIVLNGGGGIYTEGTHSENQNPGAFNFSPLLNQFTTYGANFHITSQFTNSMTSQLKGWRAEDNIIGTSVSQGGFYGGSSDGFSVFGSSAIGVDIYPWASVANTIAQQGFVVYGGSTVSTYRAFMLVDTGGTIAWSHITSKTSNSITDSTASWTVNQWVGYRAFLRFGSNGFSNSCGITANDATTLTLDCTPSTQNMYQIAGSVGAAEPTWSSASDGFQANFTPGGDEFITHAGSDCVEVNQAFVRLNVNDYIVVPDSKSVAPVGSPIFRAPLYGKVLSKDGTHACDGSAGASIVVNNVADYSRGPVPGYYGTPIASGTQGVKWINILYSSYYGANIIQDSTSPFGAKQIPSLVNGMISRTLNPRRDWYASPFGARQFQDTDNSPTIINLEPGIRVIEQCNAITPAATIDMTNVMGSCQAANLTPAEDETLNAPVPISGQMQEFTLFVNGSTTPHLITFGNNFTANGPLNTGSTSQIFALVFRANGEIGVAQWQEITRTPATLSARLDQDFAKTTDTSLANVTGNKHNLVVDLEAAKTYSFEVYLPWTDATTGGVQAAIAGTATATDIRYNGWIVDSAANGIKGSTEASSLGTAVATATTTGTTGAIVIKGTITVANAGTLTVQFAQNTSDGTASTVKRGAYFLVNNIP